MKEFAGIMDAVKFRKFFIVSNLEVEQILQIIKRFKNTFSMKIDFKNACSPFPITGSVNPRRRHNNPAIPVKLFCSERLLPI